MKKRLCVLVVCMFFGKLYSQSPIDVIGIPSPNATSLGMINEVPVSLYTGKCDIKIPIYELKEGDITVPIYLSYNSSGVKPDVHPGWVGLNWSLQAGGMITRIVKGIPDETAWEKGVKFNDSGNSTFCLDDDPGYLYHYAKNNISDWSSETNVLNKAKSTEWVDTDPDQFNFNIDGYTGTFYIGENGNIYCATNPDIKVEIGDLVAIPFPSYLVSPAIIHSMGTIDGLYQKTDVEITGFKITMPNGFQYLFGCYGFDTLGEDFENLRYMEASTNFFSKILNSENWNTWLLQKIKSPNGFEVTFNYEEGEPIASFYRTIAFEKTNANASPKGLFKNFSNISVNTTNTYDKYDGDIIFNSYLSSIETSTQKIDFFTSRTNELTYNYLYIAYDLHLQSYYYPYWLHCYSPRYVLASFASCSPPDNVYCIPRSDMDYYSSNIGYAFDNTVIWNQRPLFRVFTVEEYPNIYVDYVDEKLDFNQLQWHKLDQISLYSKSESKYLKKWNFGYNNKSDERLMLLSLQELGESGKINPPYTFEYEDYYGIGKYAGAYKLPPYNSYLLDHWGYYNGTNSNISNFDTANMNGYYNKRNANETYLYSGQLNKINYPLGGSVEFTYEPNKFSKTIKRNKNTGNFETANHSTPIIGGGLRIKNIKYKDVNSTTSEKSYVYSDGIMGHEVKYYWPDYKGKLQSNTNATYTRERFVSQNLLPLCGGLDYSISYPKVEEIITGNGKIEYYYSNHLTNPDENFINTIDAEKSISSPFSSKDFERGKILRKITKDANGTIKRKENYTYAKNTNVSRDYIRAIATRQFPVIDGWAIEGASYKQYIYPYELKTVVDSVYNSKGSNPVITKKDFSYNSKNLLSLKNITNSDGKIHKTEYLYPSDKIIEPYITMTNKNILTPVVGEWEYVEDMSVSLQNKLTEYRSWGNNIFAPEYVKLQTRKQSSPETRITYHKYDIYGNPLYISKDDNVEKITYLWGYHHQYPIAEIKNATYDQVKNALNGGESLINRVANAFIPADNDLEAINNLRTTLPNAFITTYTYKPFVGMEKVPMGRTTGAGWGFSLGFLLVPGSRRSKSASSARFSASVVTDCCISCFTIWTPAAIRSRIMDSTSRPT